MKTKLMILVTLLIGGSVSYASFECFEKSGKVKVVALHEESLGWQKYATSVMVQESGKLGLKFNGLVHLSNTRLGFRYNYDLQDKNIRFSITENTQLVKNPNCIPNARVDTCDYVWVEMTNYSGNLNLNGKIYALACKAI